LLKDDSKDKQDLEQDEGLDMFFNSSQGSSASSTSQEKSSELNEILKDRNAQMNK
jgi:hypothetical protein